MMQRQKHLLLSTSFLILCFLWTPSPLQATPHPNPTTHTTKKKIIPTHQTKKSTQRKKIQPKKQKTSSPQGLSQLKLKKWLLLGPAPLPLPAFHKNTQKKYSPKKLLTFNHLRIHSLKPLPKMKQPWLFDKTLTWHHYKKNPSLQKNHPQIAYLATYINVDRYLKLSLKIKSHQYLRLFLDGRSIAYKKSCTPLPKKNKNSHTPHKIQKNKLKNRKTPTKLTQKNKKQRTKRPNKLDLRDQLLINLTKLLQQQTKILQQQTKMLAQQNALLTTKTIKKTKSPKAGWLRTQLTLEPGKHLLVLKILYTPQCLANWTFQAQLKKTKTSSIPPTLETSLNDQEHYSINFLLNRKRLISTTISPDGRYTVVSTYWIHPDGQREYWQELYRLKDGKLLHSSRSKYFLQNFQWAPDSKYYTFKTYNRKKKNASLWLVNRQTHQVKLLRHNIRSFAHHIWSHDGRFIIYNTFKKTKPSKVEKIGLKRLRGMEDRWPWYRSQSYIHAMSPDGTFQIQLTATSQIPYFADIRYDGKKILLTQKTPDYNDPPVSKVDVYELDLNTLKMTKILSNLKWLEDVRYSPKGDKLLILGRPDLFGIIGRSPKLPPKTQTNDFDTQAYIYNLKTKEISCISKNFAPTIFKAHWHPLTGYIYFEVLDRTYRRLFQYNPKTKKFSPIPTGTEQTTHVSFASHSYKITYFGQNMKHPNRLYTLDLRHPQPKMLLAPNAQWLKKIHLGKIHDWHYIKKNGQKIEGRFYLPPQFDPRKKYPLIVYYYGGTFPTIRSFDSSFSAPLWASHGYIVYILQPSGALGYGQRFSALHVNEWGSRVAQEITTGIRHFLKKHPFANPKKVGCIGASYGGFMTMYLATHDNACTTFISHAGISNITSYWGAGYWGFLYSSVAAARRYPWSHRKFFINQSPLYSAHKVHSPILLIHGTRDHNVPTNESIQMYTALKLLHKQVELVLVKGAGHGVYRYKQRKLWVKTIIAWFDKYLKNQPLWWNTLYGTQQH